MRFEDFTFGSIRIDGVTYEHDVMIDRGQVSKRKKKPSRKFRGEFGHTPLSLEEKIPWKCRRLVVGTGTGALPVMEDVKREAKRRRIELLILPTVQAIEVLERDAAETNAVLHVTLRGPNNFSDDYVATLPPVRNRMNWCFTSGLNMAFRH